MTFRKWVYEYCSNRGMFDDDANAVLASLTADNMLPIPWDRDIAGYPAVLLAALALLVNHTALAYIEAHTPDAWYKSMFSTECKP